MGEWHKRNRDWKYRVEGNLAGQIFPSTDRPGYLYAHATYMPHMYFPQTQLAEAKAWVEAMYSLNN